MSEIDTPNRGAKYLFFDDGRVEVNLFKHYTRLFLCKAILIQLTQRLCNVTFSYRIRKNRSDLNND
jgi:hypothetical protein